MKWLDPMNPPPPPLDGILARLANLPAAAAAEEARADQQTRWAAGERVLAEQYLARLPRIAANPADALVLIYGEVLLRTELGQAVDPDTILARFPQYHDALVPLFEVHSVLDPTASPAEVPLLSDLPPTIAGYDRLELAGRGGMGVIYRARHTATGRSVAVKVVRAGAAGTPELVRFLQEVDVLARLAHPNVVRFEGSGVAAGRPYLVTEWVAGGSLADRPGGPKAAPDKAVAIVRGAALGLGAAHTAGVIHRDVKPGNILLGEHETPGGAAVPKLTDFGLARLLGCGGTLTATGEVLGTWRYMPPEQIEGRAREVGPWSDLFSLGAVLYELLTGRPAFPGRDRAAGPAVSHNPLAPRELDPAIPAHLDAACVRALRPDPRDRFQTAAEFVAALGLR
jgi:serine/threonine-protein kinase